MELKEKIDDLSIRIAELQQKIRGGTSTDDDVARLEELEKEYSSSMNEWLSREKDAEIVDPNDEDLVLEKPGDDDDDDIYDDNPDDLPPEPDDDSEEEQDPYVAELKARIDDIAPELFKLQDKRRENKLTDDEKKRLDELEPVYYDCMGKLADHTVEKLKKRE